MGFQSVRKKYIKELLKKFNMLDSKPIDNPMGINSKLVVEEFDTLVNQTCTEESLDPCCI